MTTNKLRSRLLLVIAVSVSALFLIAANMLTANRKLEGSAKVSICGKFADGTWQTLDSVDIGNLGLEATVLEIATRKEVKTDFSFSGRSVNGRQISVVLSRPGKLDPNLISGDVTLDLPVEMTVDGKKFNVVLNLTTKTAKSTTGGVISGHPMNIDHATHTAKLKMVGNGDFKGVAFDDAIALYRRSVMSSTSRSAGPQPKIPTELFLVVESEGQAAILGGGKK